MKSRKLREPLKMEKTLYKYKDIIIVIITILLKKKMK